MKVLFIALSFILASQSALAEGPTRILCHDRFADEIWEMTGERVDDKGCKAMLISGTVGICFEGDEQEIARQMNAGVFEYSDVQKVLIKSAEVISANIVRYGSYEGDYAPLSRSNNEIFRCPEFDQIKQNTTELATALDSSVEYAPSHIYREKFGLPAWLK